MRSSRPTASRSATLQKLTKLAKQWVDAENRPESLHWESQLAGEIDTMLKSGKDTALVSVLDELWQSDPKAYELLADFVEDRTQTHSSIGEPNILLIAIPVLAWSRNQLPLGETPQHVVDALINTLKTHCLAPDVDLQLGHTLYAPDSLPQGFAQTAKLAKKYFDSAKKSQNLAFSKNQRNDVDPLYLADSRFWLGTLRAKDGLPLFKWQIEQERTTECYTNWNRAAFVVTADMFLGCSHVVLPPSAYFSACRKAERDIRPFSLQAATLMITSSLEIGSDALKAVIGACWGSGFEEYRISLIERDTDTIIQGVSWPLLSHDEDEHTILSDILKLLKTLNIEKITVLDEKLPMEYCDDCGAPLFPNSSADMIHPGSIDDEDPDQSKLVVH